MKKFYTKALFSVMLLFFLVAPLFAHAVWNPSQPIIPCNSADPNDATNYCDFNKLVLLGQNIITALLYIAIPLAAISFSYAGFLYLTAVGDTGKISQAHKIFWNVMVGFLFALAAWLIVYAITSALLDSSKYTNLLS